MYGEVINNKRRSISICYIAKYLIQCRKRYIVRHSYIKLTHTLKGSEIFPSRPFVSHFRLKYYLKDTN